MGAFYFCPKEQAISKDIKLVFTKKGFSEPTYTLQGKSHFLFYKKQLFDSINELHHSDSSLYIIGTCFYKKKGYKDGLNTILQDFINKQFDPNQLVGSYFLLFYHNNEFCFYSDKASTQNIFYHEKSGIVTSSFLACIVGVAEFSGKLNLNFDALSEILITGNLIGPETLVNEIIRYEPAIQVNLPNIKRISENNFIKNDKSEDIGTFETEVVKQQFNLENYFTTLKTNLDSLGAITGLTGGFDSRLLFLNLKKASNNYVIYSTSRAKPTVEFECASALAKATGDIIQSPAHTLPEKLDSISFLNLLTDNLYFNDGLIRSHQLWTEEIKGRRYLESLYGDKKIGFSGVGGEQYRNSEFLIKKKYLYKNWLYYELIYRHSKNVFISNKYKNQILERIYKKIANLLELEKQNNKISSFNIKRYFNEIYNPANRVVRNNIENQLIFFLSPFTEYNISNEAYRAFPFIGSNLKFEKEMIGHIAPDLAHIKLDYGFAVSENVSLQYKLIPVLKCVLGLNFFHRIIYFVSRNKNQNNFNKIITAHPILEKYLSKLESVGLPLKINMLKKNNYHSPLLIEAGFFLDEMKNYIKYD